MLLLGRGQGGSRSAGGTPPDRRGERSSDGGPRWAEPESYSADAGVDPGLYRLRRRRRGRRGLGGRRQGGRRFGRRCCSCSCCGGGSGGVVVVADFPSSVLLFLLLLSLSLFRPGNQAHGGVPHGRERVPPCPEPPPPPLLFFDDVERESLGCLCSCSSSRRSDGGDGPRQRQQPALPRRRREERGSPPSLALRGDEDVISSSGDPFEREGSGRRSSGSGTAVAPDRRRQRAADGPEWRRRERAGSFRASLVLLGRRKDH